MPGLGATLASELLEVHVLRMALRIVRHCSLPYISETLIEGGRLETVCQEQCLRATATNCFCFGGLEQRSTYPVATV